MKGKKLEVMARSDMRKRKEYTKYGVEDCRMAFRLETDVPTCRPGYRYGQDLRCRECNQGQEQEQEEQEQEQGEQGEQREKGEQGEQEQTESQEQIESQGQIESQENLECCP